MVQQKNEWDKPLSFDRLWEQYNRIIKDNGAAEKELYIKEVE